MLLRSILTSLTNRIVAHRRFLGACLVGASLGAGVCAFVAFAGGCGLQERKSTIEQQQREKVVQSSGAEFAQSVKPQPFTVEVPQKGGDPIKIQAPAPAETKASTTANESSDSKASGNAAESESFPFFVKLIGVAVGLALIGGLIWLARRSSAAVNAAWSQVDDMIASRIKTVGALKGAASDPSKIAQLTEEESRLNALRAEAAK